MDKISAQPKYINMYSWVQFQISCVKCDLGLIIFFAISFTLGINRDDKLNIAYFILDSLMVLFSLGITLGLNYNVVFVFFIYKTNLSIYLFLIQI